jgi:hypothetical protein
LGRDPEWGILTTFLDHFAMDFKDTPGRSTIPLLGKQCDGESARCESISIIGDFVKRSVEYGVYEEED